jgi:hypothetical protein
MGRFNMKKAIYLLTILLIVLSVLSYSCGNSDIVSRQSVGKIVSVTYKPLGGIWGGTVTIINTEKISVAFSGYNISPIEIGAEAFIITTKRGSRYFTWEGHNKGYPL